MLGSAQDPCGHLGGTANTAIFRNRVAMFTTLVVRESVAVCDWTAGHAYY
jgi:hypothetical protein